MAIAILNNNYANWMNLNLLASNVVVVEGVFIRVGCCVSKDAADNVYISANSMLKSDF